MMNINGGWVKIMHSNAYFSKGKLLLLDLDGVLVTDGSGDTKVGSEIIAIHKHLIKQLEALSIPIAILTHRSRGEALQIIQALGLSGHRFLGVFTANDIFVYGLRFKGVSFLIENGSRKSIVLSYIKRRFNILAANIAFIDDRLGNVEDLLNAGIGLGINVPAARVIEEGKIETFDLNKALGLVETWCEQSALSKLSNTVTHLPVVTLDLAADAASGIILRRQWWDLFGMGRSGLRHSRQLILRLL